MPPKQLIVVQMVSTSQQGRIDTSTTQITQVVTLPPTPASPTESDQTVESANQTVESTPPMADESSNNTETLNTEEPIVPKSPAEDDESISNVPIKSKRGRRPKRSRKHGVPGPVQKRIREGIIPDEEEQEGDEERSANVKQGNDEESSSTSVDDLEVCAECFKSGEVIECDYEGCGLVYHVACVPKLNGKIPKGRWICYAKHIEKCEVCGGPGKVIVCDVVNCGRMYHLSCVPELKGEVPATWECPKCIEERDLELTCAACGEDQEKDAKSEFVKCSNCSEAVHLKCLHRYEASGQIDCVSCALREVLGSTENLVTKGKKEERMTTHGTATKPRTTDMMFVRIKFTKGISDIDKARVVQIIRGEAQGLSKDEAYAILDHSIASRKFSSVAI